MPDIDQNRGRWARHPWEEKEGGGGERWSRLWGGTDYKWWGTLFPRLQEFLPAGTVLEIATGYGRFTHYLVHLCDRYIGIDLMEQCVEHCRATFADHAHASFHRNDGLSLEAAPDGEVDFAFSFDSLVHVERDVLQSYVEQLARKLSPDGVGFLHHSNLGQYVDPVTGKLPFRNVNVRAESTSARLFEEFCDAAGLCCIGQELVNRGTDVLNDCFSLVTRPGSRFKRPNHVRENPHFMKEAAAILEIAQFYGSSGLPSVQPAPVGTRARRVLGARITQP